MIRLPADAGYRPGLISWSVNIMWKRIIAAAKVLWGTRPAEAQFDELDERIADSCACQATERIMDTFLREPDPTHPMCPLWGDVWYLVGEAIRLYARHEATEGPWCREKLEADDALMKKARLKQKQAESDEAIPF